MPKGALAPGAEDFPIQIGVIFIKIKFDFSYWFF